MNVNDDSGMSKDQKVTEIVKNGVGSKVSLFLMFDQNRSLKELRFAQEKVRKGDVNEWSWTEIDRTLENVNEWNWNGIDQVLENVNEWNVEEIQIHGLKPSLDLNRSIEPSRYWNSSPNLQSLSYLSYKLNEMPTTENLLSSLKEYNLFPHLLRMTGSGEKKQEGEGRGEVNEEEIVEEIVNFHQCLPLLCEVFVYLHLTCHLFVHALVEFF